MTSTPRFRDIVQGLSAVVLASAIGVVATIPAVFLFGKFKGWDLSELNFVSRAAWYEVDGPLSADRAREVIDRVRERGLARKGWYDDSISPPRFMFVGEKSSREVARVLDKEGLKVGVFSFGPAFTILDTDRLFDLDTVKTGEMFGIHLIVQALTFVVVAAFATRRQQFQWRPRTSPAVAVGLGLLTGIASSMGTWLLAGLQTRLGLPVEEQVWVRQLLWGPDRSWFLVVVVVIAGPVAEELLFRGYVFRCLSRNGGRLLAYGGSAALFAMVHFNWSAVPVYLFYGVVFAYTYQRTRRLVTPITAHMLVNGAAVFVMGG